MNRLAPSKLEALITMTKLQSSLDEAMEMLRDLEEFKRSGSKEAFRKQLRRHHLTPKHATASIHGRLDRPRAPVAIHFG